MGEKINNYGVGDVQADSIMETLDTQRVGYHALTITEYDTDTKPAIAAGSKIEINGALFEFDSEETISGTPSDGDVYILLTPSGDSVTASFTNTAPTWSDSKHGWYGTGGSANYRYANFIMTKSGTDYSDKRYYQHDPLKKFDTFSVDTFDFDSFATQDISQNGYIKLGQLYVQWGSETLTSKNANSEISFPISFPNACFSVAWSGGYSEDVGDHATGYIKSFDTDGFIVDSNNSDAIGGIFSFIAIGY